MINPTAFFEFLTTGIVFFLILTVLVLIHEFGHFIVARLIGVDVEEFGFGLPPRIWGKKIGKTLYSVNWLPFGGFVRLAGEDEEDGQIQKHEKGHTKQQLQKYFWARTKLERSAILLAGVTMNFLLAVALTSILVTWGIQEPVPRVYVKNVAPDSPASMAGILPEDRIIAVTVTQSGKMAKIHTKRPEDLQSNTKLSLGIPMTVTVLREGKSFDVSLTPRKNPPEGQGALGLAIDYDSVLLKVPWYRAPFTAVGVTLRRGQEMITSIASLPVRLLTQQGNVAEEVAGPIGIAQITGQARKIGIDAVLNLISILSLSLAILNTVPIPALDGGRLLFVLVEAVLGKRVRPAFERNAHQIGMIILLSLIVLVSINDILRLFRGF